jgi:hypothetical protein
MFGVRPQWVPGSKRVLEQVRRNLPPQDIAEVELTEEHGPFGSDLVLQLARGSEDNLEVHSVAEPSYRHRDWNRCESQRAPLPHR